MIDQYVWLLKGDNIFKDYQEKNWHTVLSVRTISNDTYYCYTNNKHFVNDEEKNILLTPICINNKSYHDCIITFDENDNEAFFWKGKRCFKLERSLANDFITSKIDYSKNIKIINVKSISQIVSDNKIQVRSSASLIYIMIFSIALIFFLSVGMYLWLF